MEPRRPSALQISSPSLFDLPQLDDEDQEDPASSSASSSPATFPANSPPTPATAPLPTTAPAQPKQQKEKRKRSRVTPDQLVHLERFFALDRSPTAARRREISELLRMNERQTQIWFQNRRAKAKLQETKKQLHNLHHSQHHSLTSPPDTPPQLSAGFERELHDLIQETEPITIIPCTDLSIGSWRRIASTTSRHDLVAYYSPSRRCLTWFIHSAGYGFKMEVPYSSITRTDLVPLAPTTPHAPGNTIATFYLSRPPMFSLEQGGVWKKCQDWTEGTQASLVLKHDLIGHAAILGHVVQALNQADPAQTPGLQPPLSDLTVGHGRKRSFSGPPSIYGPPVSGVSGPSYETYAPGPGDYPTTPLSHPHSQTHSPISHSPLSHPGQLNAVSAAGVGRPYTAPSRLFDPGLHSAPPDLYHHTIPTPSQSVLPAEEPAGSYSLAGALGGHSLP